MYSFLALSQKIITEGGFIAAEVTIQLNFIVINVIKVSAWPLVCMDFPKH